MLKNNHYKLFFSVRIAKNNKIEVWVQGELDGVQWLFDDKTPIPDICPLNLGDTGAQEHMRTRSSSSCQCSHAEDARLCKYSCEYHFLPSFNN